MNAQEKFNQSQEEVKNLTKRPNNDELLSLYSLFKQASQGDVAGSRPGMIKIKERAKWDAWKKLEGMERSTAIDSYNELVETLKNNYGMGS
jgi:diazepam-binding inhibitor (GABA receptor modulator, acyl-CoA-binding protein)